MTAGTLLAYQFMSLSGTTTAVEHNTGLRAGGGAELEPEVVLPSQYFGSAMVDASLQPEKRLMLAVLEDAVGTFQKYVNARERNGQHRPPPSSACLHAGQSTQNRR